MNQIVRCLLLQMVAATACRHVMCQYTSLNYAAQAARVALHNSAVVAQLLSDINKVNFEDVHVCTYVSFIIFLKLLLLF